MALVSSESINTSVCLVCLFESPEARLYTHDDLPHNQYLHKKCNKRYQTNIQSVRYILYKWESAVVDNRWYGILHLSELFKKSYSQFLWFFSYTHLLHIWTFCLFVSLQPEKLNVYKNDSDTSWDYTLGKRHSFIFFIVFSIVFHIIFA